jgi:putative ABC transport system permease protein
MVGRPRALQRMVLRDLWHLRSQMVAVAVVLSCGIAMFVSLRSMHGWLRETQAGYYEQYRFADVFAGVSRAPAALEARLRAVPGVADVRTRVVMDVTLDLPGLDEPGTGRLVGIPELHTPVLNDLHLRQGRWIRAGHPEEVLVSEAFARANDLAPGDALQAVVRGSWQTLRIVGLALSPEYIYEIRGLGDIFPDNRRFGVIWMGDAALGAAFHMERTFNDVSVSLAPGAHLPDVLAALDRLLVPYGGTGAYARADQLSHLFIAGEIEETQVTSILIPAIFLGVTAFLLNMVLARLVATQRDQIALLKAFGYSSSALARHYLQMALGPVLIGAVAGIGLGSWLAGELSRVYARFYQFPDATYAQDLGVVLAAFVVAGGAALLGALGAVRRVVRLPPAEAMRPEAPTSFGRGVVERLGIQRWVPSAQRIILRNVERQPLRSFLAVTGIALALSIVMAGWFLFDALEVMKQVQFEEVQRYDAMVVFDSPRSERAGSELAALDGVRRLEPFRAVPVQLTHGSLSKRTTILGQEPGGELHRVVDRDGVVYEVPRRGLLLSGVLARKLRLAAGDVVRVEVLEGKRAVRTVVVAGIADDIMGSTAMMARGSLHELLGEGPRLSGAYLTVDPLRAPAVYRTLKATPAVSGVVVRDAVVRGFEETIAESFSISLTLMVGFASVISAGIIYNGARVALSERGRELASLRVLGFTRGEVTRLLLGEQALLTTVGLPVGLLLGYGLIWLIAYRFDSELFRIPMVIRGPTIVYSMLVVIATALLSALAIRRRIHRLDLVAVLKTRE